MKSNLFFFFTILIVLFSCQKSPNENSDVQEEEPLTYAEISIAQGGQWVDKVYQDGTSFKNVDHLVVPDSHTDHSYYIRYEGPGWESNLVGYRLYLDWRNGIDIFGKKTNDLVLHQVGQDGFDSYHEPADWGVDILKVGKSLGLGSYGRLVNNEVLHFQEVENTEVEVKNTTNNSAVHIQYDNWTTDQTTIDLDVTLSISPDSRLTHTVLKPSKPTNGLTTGIVIHPEATYFESESNDAEWSYIATFGKQTLFEDDLGMVIFYRNNQIVEKRKGEYDHLLIFGESNSSLEYYFGAAWSKEPNGIDNQDDFIKYVNDELNRLNQN